MTGEAVNRDTEARRLDAPWTTFAETLVPSSGPMSSVESAISVTDAETLVENVKITSDEGVYEF